MANLVFEEQQRSTTVVELIVQSSAGGKKLMSEDYSPLQHSSRADKITDRDASRIVVIIIGTIEVGPVSLSLLNIPCSCLCNFQRWQASRLMPVYVAVFSLWSRAGSCLPLHWSNTIKHSGRFSRFKFFFQQYDGIVRLQKRSFSRLHHFLFRRWRRPTRLTAIET